MNRSTLISLPALLLASTTVLAACGGGDMGGMDMGSTPSSSVAATASGSTAGTPSADRNEADVMFAQTMIVHHRSAIDMAKLAGTKASTAEVKALAGKIQAAQQPEIDLMTSWLKAWGAPTDGGMGGMDGMEGMEGMEGMDPEQQMAELEKAEGVAFDRMFLEMMTEHHRSAVVMAKEQQAKGKNPEAVALAKKIVADQTAEIAEMQKMLAKL